MCVITFPYKHPLNDYISIVGGFERELDNDIGPNVTLETQTAVIGAERIIKIHWAVGNKPMAFAIA